MEENRNVFENEFPENTPETTFSPVEEENPVTEESATEEFTAEQPEAEETAPVEPTPSHDAGYTVQNPNAYYNYSRPTFDGRTTDFAVKPKPVKKKKNGLLIALICVSVLLVISIVVSMVGIGYFVMRSQNKTPQNEGGNQVVIGNDGKQEQPESNQVKPEVNVVQNSKDDGKKMSIEMVVDKTLPQVVGVVVSTGQGFYGSESQGSGIIFSADGYIITNAHVVDGANEVRIVLPDEQQTTYDAKVIGSDTKTDLAVLKVDAKDLPAADIGNSDELKLGETVIAVGNPYGLELQSSVTSGIVSALNRSITTNNGKMKLIQTDAAINPGNSGGALVNLYGQVVGVCSSKIAATDAEGLGFAIPINDALPIIKELISKGYISGRPMIGIQGQDISAQTAMMYGVPTGVYVVYIEQNSNAYQKGMRQYDIITKFNGKTVTCYADLDAAKDECKAGDTVSVEFYRYTNGKTYTLDITLSASSGK